MQNPVPPRWKARIAEDKEKSRWPPSQTPTHNRPVFAHLRKLSVDIAKKNIDNITMSILSMGMTNDYQVAIEEGATMIRVGTGIFGARDYTHQV